MSPSNTNNNSVSKNLEEIEMFKNDTKEQLSRIYEIISSKHTETQEWFNGHNKVFENF